jgi:hypothetical protein
MMEPHMFENYINMCLCMQYMWVSYYIDLDEVKDRKNIYMTNSGRPALIQKL